MGLLLWQPGCRYPHRLHGGIWLSVTVEDWNAIYFVIFARRPALKDNTCTKLVSHCTLWAEGQNVPIKLCMCMFYWAAACYHHFCYYIIRIVISLLLYRLSLFIITSVFVLFADLAVRSLIHLKCHVQGQEHLKSHHEFPDEGSYGRWVYISPLGD